MKKILSLTLAFCMLSASCFASIVVDATQCKKTGQLQSYLNKAARQKDKTLIIDGANGTIYSDSISLEYKEIHIEGINNAVIDFSSTIFIKGKLLETIRKFMIDNKKWMLQDYDREMYERLRESGGITLDNCSNSSIKNLKVMNAQYSGIFIHECENILVESVESCYNHYQGFAALAHTGSKGPSTFCKKINFKNCYAHGNYDDFTLGEEGDGFFISTNTTDILLEDCLAECNSDHGFDTCNSLGNVTFRRCVARYNGFSEEQVLSGAADNSLNKGKAIIKNEPEPGKWDIGSDGGGFQPAFWGTTFAKDAISGKNNEKPEDYKQPFYFYQCVAFKNYYSGFTRSLGPNPLNLEDCYSMDNGVFSFKFNVNKTFGDEFLSYGMPIINKLVNCYERQGYNGNSFENNYGNSKLYPENSKVLKTAENEASVLTKLGINFNWDSPIKSVLNKYNNEGIKKTAFVFSEEIPGIKDNGGAQTVTDLSIASDYGSDMELSLTADGASRHVIRNALMITKSEPGVLTLKIKKDGELTFQYEGIQSISSNYLALYDENLKKVFIKYDFNKKDKKDHKEVACVKVKAGTYTMQALGISLYSFMLTPQ